MAVAAGMLAGVLGCTKDQTVAPAMKVPKPPVQVVQVEPPRDDGEKRKPQATTCAKAGLMFEQAGDKSKTDLARQSSFDQARKAYNQALELDPKHQPALLGLARLYDKEGNYGRAVVAYQQGLERRPEDPALWFELGMCWGRQKQWDKAIPCLEKAVALAPDNGILANHLGFALARAGRYDESYEQFRRVVGDGKANFNLARMSQHNGHPDLCRRFLHAALRADPQLTEARQMLAQLETPAPEIQQAGAIEQPQ
jgi:tetratricopeptide (TPR) repeat protein